MKSFTAALLLVTILFPGFLAAQDGILEQSKRRDILLTSEQLRLLVNDYITLYTSVIEREADIIFEGVTDRAVRRNALIWKIYAISEGYQSAGHDDPAVAFLDLRILVEQMDMFVRDGGGATLFGSEQARVQEAVRTLHIELLSVGTRISSDAERREQSRVDISRYAAAHPLRTLYFDRTSVIPWLVENYSPKRRSGLFPSTVNLEANLSGITALLNSYMDILPRQVRWQAQLLFIDGLDEPEIAQLLKSAQSFDEFVEGIDQLIIENREIMLEAIDEERQDAMGEFRALTEEVKLFAAEQRVMIMNRIVEERVKTTEEVGIIAADSIDHFFDRALPLIGGVGAAGVILGLVAGFLLGRGRA